jgi:hypothetical protein
MIEELIVETAHRNLDRWCFGEHAVPWGRRRFAPCLSRHLSWINADGERAGF